ncbi:hypothetical protein BU17DRAFT_85905 [Hysterangium stoloniferum]|nr:hypothetical protein BU17DRAFT_85905 [Hysterangium stoloniferum]
MDSSLSCLKDRRDSGIWETVATWHPPSSQYAHFQPSTYTIPYPSSPRPVPAPNSSSRLALPGLTPASPVQNPPPSQSSMPPRSKPFPTGHCQKALFATGEAVVVVDWTCRSSGPVPAPNSSSRLAFPDLTPASPVQKPPPNLQRPVRSHSPPVVVSRHYLLPGMRLLWLIGYVEVPGSNNPSVQSKVAPASDSGPEHSVE